MCAYPSSRRSRTTQPTNVDPFIDNLSHLEARIRRIESDLEKQRNVIKSITPSPNMIETKLDRHKAISTKVLNSKSIKTDKDAQESRSTLTQQRIPGEQRLPKSKRPSSETIFTPEPSSLGSPTSITKTLSSSILAKHAKLRNNRFIGNSNIKQSNVKSTSNQTNNHANANMSTGSISSAAIAVPDTALYSDSNYEVTFSNRDVLRSSSVSSSFDSQGMGLVNSNSLPSAPYDHLPTGHGLDWTLFDQEGHYKYQNQQMERACYPHQLSETIQQEAIDLFTSDFNMFQEMSMSPTSTRSSSLVSHSNEYSMTLQPSNSTGSTLSTMTGLSSTNSCSSINTCNNSIFNFSIDNVMLHPSNDYAETGQQGIKSI